MLNGGVHSKTVKFLKRSDQVHIIHMSKKLLKPVPINVSSHDLHENRLAGKKEKSKNEKMNPPIPTVF